MATATLNSHRATSARVQIPAYGCWYAEVSLDGEHTIASGAAAELKIGDLTLSGTVLSGGPDRGRSHYRIIGGKGGWGKTIPKKSYANDAGVKIATALGDAAREAGETLGTVSTSDRLGPAWVRQAGPASAVLELVAPRGWYIDAAGVTQLGARTPGSVPAGAQRVKPADLARGTVVLASERIATLTPGTVVDGLTAVDVQHELSQGGLRTTIWGARSTGGKSRGLETLSKLLDIIDPDRAYRGVYEYRVVTQEGKRLNLQPVRVSAGMPDLARVVVRPGVAGCEADVALGSRVLVGFIEADPARPYVAAHEDAEGEGFVPTLINLANGSAFLARVGDSVSVNIVSLPVVGGGGGSVSGTASGTITSGSSKVKCG